ncbi:MAG: cellobiose phosphorylase [Oscillospiraceae bacterium]|jgi:cellobiose phosphorylase|nr:cellobiose phosphorylase [Oscillospiraceae bacterium]
MKLTPNQSFITFERGESSFRFLPSGSLYEILCGPILVNQFLGTMLDGPVSGIWLRVYPESGAPAVYPLTSGSAAVSDDRLVRRGEAGGIQWALTFYPVKDGLWLWDVALSGEGTVDVIYGQDLGMGSRGGVLTNELYISQYLGHTVFEGENGYAVCSRQNQPQPAFPYLQQGMVRGRAVHYSTDGIQFFGLSAKEEGKAAALSGDLADENLQFEFAYTALQSEKIALKGSASFTFYGLFRPDCPDAVRALEYRDEVLAALGQYEAAAAAPERPLEPVCRAENIGEPYCSPVWSEGTAAEAFPERVLEERQEGALQSFFTPAPDYAHVVLQQKELQSERPHGVILMSGLTPDAPPEEAFSVTNYMYGLFAGQLVVGNTSQHKLISTPRGLLNLQHNQGLRIYLGIDGAYRLLTLPAAYEMGKNYTRWYYELPGDRLRVTVFLPAAEQVMVLSMESLSGKSYEALVTMQLCMNEHEFTTPVEVSEIDGGFRFTAGEGAVSRHYYPGLHFDLTPSGCWERADDGVFFADGKGWDGTLFTLHTKGDFSLAIEGHLEEATPSTAKKYDFDKEKAAANILFERLKAGFTLSKPGNRQVETLNAIADWYTHNAMIHFASPHGLEQPGGAAWGTRDVCQGPFEYFLTVGNLPMLRKILLMIFSHQQLETGEWAQWFMFDRYPFNAGDCHGDIVFWPLKCAADYLAASGDSSILRESLPYVSQKDGCPVQERESFLEHLKRAAATLKASRFLPGTALISYAGGDWDDTLQPADPAMKRRLVSAWTQALAYQVVKGLGKALENIDPDFSEALAKTASAICRDFNHYLVRDGVIAGFIRQEDDGSFSPMLHPDDQLTGIHYRLLPMTRSIIAEMVTPEQAGKNMKLIDKHLACPDGVRLMDAPTRYDGGVSHLFRRAEQAANVGREISLQYTHAHIRYIEALAKLGEGSKAWDALFRITPIGITEAVPNARLRQANLYFSSSDGCFPDRFRYSEEFSRLRNGTIDVKGGWRLYSSGPGIYFHQLVAALLGVRFEQDALVIDPVLPASMDGLRLTLCCFGRPCAFVYRAGREKGLSCGGKALPASPVGNPYRAGGWRLSKGTLLAAEGDITVTAL